MARRNGQDSEEAMNRGPGPAEDARQLLPLWPFCHLSDQRRIAEPMARACWYKVMGELDWIGWRHKVGRLVDIGGHKEIGRANKFYCTFVQLRIHKIFYFFSENNAESSNSFVYFDD